MAYACSKGALLTLSRSLAAAWGKENIQVNCLVPGAINSPFLNTMLANPTKLACEPGWPGRVQHAHTWVWGSAPAASWHRLMQPAVLN